MFTKKALEGLPGGGRFGVDLENEVMNPDDFMRSAGIAMSGSSSEPIPPVRTTEMYQEHGKGPMLPVTPRQKAMRKSEFLERQYPGTGTSPHAAGSANWNRPRSRSCWLSDNSRRNSSKKS